MSRWVEELDDEVFEEWLEDEPLFLVDFYADWCGPCKAVAPVVERAAKHYAGRITFGKLNIDYSPESAARYGVRSIPTMILFRDGKQTTRLQGYVPDGKLRIYLDRYAPAIAEGAAEQEDAAPAKGGLLSRILARR
jgi:thioredoxin